MAPNVPDGQPRTMPAAPQGGLIGPGGRVRRWRWIDNGAVASRPLRCGGDQSYVVQASTRNGAACELVCHFLLRNGENAWHRVGIGPGERRLACVTTPDHCTHLSIAVPRHMAGDVADVHFRETDEPVAESHPLANVPRWSRYAPPFAPRRVLLPPELARMAGHVRGPAAVVDPAGLRRCAAWRGSAVVLGAAEVRQLAIGWAELRRRAGGAIVLLSFDALAAVLARDAGAGERDSTGGTDGRVMRRASRGLCSCVVEYADWATRGFALQDALPCAAVDGAKRFRLPAWTGGRGWNQFAERQGIVRLLSVRPGARGRGALSLACMVDGGAVIASDLPWLLAGVFGTPVATENIGRLVNAHLGGEVPDETQYWSASESVPRQVRDIAELCRRYAPLTAIRWASGAKEPLALGVSLAADSSPATPRGPAAAGDDVVLRTGRIDLPSELGGVPAEAMMIVMKQLARRQREGANGWRQTRRLTWQFDAAAGHAHAHLYASAGAVGPRAPARVLTVAGAEAPQAEGIRLKTRLGPLADGCHRIVEELLSIAGASLR
ncbi:MAG: hypothetical protein CHACPFDD_02947 [Phycisphaerae bacterium]|nr:hypothetical protein [Phycisphaerae bacterium]